jgi:hypothetical protein
LIVVTASPPAKLLVWIALWQFSASIVRQVEAAREARAAAGAKEREAMARFFLHLRTPQGLVSDGRGVELAHLGKVRESMTRVAVDLARNDPAAADWTFEVADEVGRTVLTEKLGALLPNPSPSA